MSQALPTLILASGSLARGNVLRAVGIDFAQMPSDVDEEPIKERLRQADATPEAMAMELARTKALAIAAQEPEAIVVGADQILECDGRCFDKPADKDGARAHLRAFRGRTHRLISAVVAARAGEVVWEHHDEARLTMRAFSDGFLESYLTAAGPGILESVGAYRLESLGAQLFERVEGDYFTVLGLPLLALLGYLRSEGLLQT